MMGKACQLALISIGVLLLSCLYVFPQQPSFTSARLSDRSAAAGLEPVFRELLSGQNTPVWIGYSVPMIPGNHYVGCGDSRFEREHKVNLEGEGNLSILFRAEKGDIQRIRTLGNNCEVDAGGLPVIWLRDVSPEESVRLLSSYAESEVDKRKNLAGSAFAAIAFHKDPSADRLLKQFAGLDQPESMREKASFWLGSARGSRGYEVLCEMLRNDPSEHVREKVIFAMSVSDVPEAISSMIDAARVDASSRVRGQALFWLSQKAGEKAAEAIVLAIDNDPESEVKRKAVFALSQLPKDEGIPRLIHVAKTNRNREVRKQAVFWLGQSKDPRALAFFEQILASK